MSNKPQNDWTLAVDAGVIVCFAKPWGAVHGKGGILGSLLLL